MAYLIIREGRQERERRVYGRIRSLPHLAEKASGFARNAEEAADIAYHELRDREDAKPLICEGGPERRMAFDDLILKRGFDPDQMAYQWGLED